MAFEGLLIQFDQIIHNSIQQYKEEILGNSRYSAVTAGQLDYLEAVSSMRDPTLSKLAARLKITKSSASIAVQKLIENGFLVKKRSNQDKRYYYFSLSDKGEALIKAEKKALYYFASSIKNSLNESEIETIEAIFGKIIKKYQ